MKEISREPKKSGQKHRALGNYFKMLRLERGWNQREVAKALGYPSSQFVSNLERGITFWQVTRLGVLHEFYGGEMENLIKLTLEEEKRSLLRSLRN